MAYTGEIAAIITAVLWSVTSIFFTEASRSVGSLVVNITRLGFAFIFLGVTILVFNIDYGLTGSQFKWLTISGIVGLVFGDGFLFRAFKDIGARLSMLLMAFVPSMSTILAFIFLDEIISLIAITGISITTAGVIMVVLQKKGSKEQEINKIGILFGILGALGQAVGLIFAKQAFIEGEINGFTATFYRIIPSIILLYPVTYFIKESKYPFKKLFSNKRGLKYTLAGTVVGPFLGITFSLIAVANTYVGIASTLMATVPIIMLPLVKFYYKEDLSLLSIIGAFLAVAGVAVLFLA